MSRIGKMPIPLTAGIQVTQEDGVVRVKGPKGELSQTVPAGINVVIEEGQILVNRESETATVRSLHGLTRSLINNMVKGVSEGFRKSLDITGVGYRAAKDGDLLVLTLGFSHPVRLTPPTGVSYTVETPTKLHIEGIDKQAVGEEAAKIRQLRKAEPYKGKGIAYVGERIRRKAGKAGKVGAKK